MNLVEAATEQRRHEVTEQELRRAEEGLVRLLHAKRFPREWIERHVPDVMGQARSDFAARLAAGKEDDTVNLLVVIGYRRAMKVLDAERVRPAMTSIETVFHLADESTPTPEEEAIDHDRQERVLRAMSHLPERQRKLLALVYFDGKSIRDAGRELGWGKSSADRHHRAALERLHEMLDRSLLSPEIPIPAYIAARHWHHDPLRAVLRWLGGAGESLGEGLVLGGGRLTQTAETGSAAAAGGAGRAAAGVCGAAVVVCITGAATGVVGPGLGAIDPGAASAPPSRSRPLSAPRQTGSPAQIPNPQPAEGGGRRSTSKRGLTGTRGSGEETAAAGPRHLSTTPDQGAGSMSSAPEASTRQTVSEFGVESGEAEEAATPTPEASSPAGAALAPSNRPAGGSSSSESPPASQASGPEFGM